MRGIEAIKHNLDWKGFEIIFPSKKQESFHLIQHFVQKYVGMKSAGL